jgi:hypothetical protein
MNKAAGRRYRYQVLEKGGSQDEMKTLTEFLIRTTLKPTRQNQVMNLPQVSVVSSVVTSDQMSEGST